MKKTRILVIFTGGTISSDAGTTSINLSESTRYALIESYLKDPLPQVGPCEFDTATPYNILSENLEGTHITSLLNCVKNNLNKGYDGIIITHGTDTLQYSAAGISYGIGADTIPVVFVSADFILSDPRSNGRANFKGAVGFIAQQLGKGTFVSYRDPFDTNEKTFIHRGTRLDYHPSFSGSLRSIDNAYYGYFTPEYRFVPNTEYKERADQTAPPEKIILTKHSPLLYIPSLPGSFYPVNLEKGGKYKGILFATYHSVTINTARSDFFDFTDAAQKASIPMYIVSDGRPEDKRYDSALKFEKAGINILPKASPIAMYMKLWIWSETGEDILYSSLSGDFL